MKPGGNVTFISDTHATKPIKKYAPYCATKAGLISLCHSFAKELAPGIRVNSVSPGTLLVREGATQEEIHRASQRTLLGRIGCPNDLVQGVLFLLRNSYITGFDLVIDGGRALL
jgi:NAD(P)-dependent dehydrogenase (short-subunit alcohol dehydrogenase family)